MLILSEDVKGKLQLLVQAVIVLGLRGEKPDDSDNLQLRCNRASGMLVEMLPIELRRKLSTQLGNDALSNYTDIIAAFAEWGYDPRS